MALLEPTPAVTGTDAPLQVWTVPTADVTLDARGFGRDTDPTLIIVGGGPGVSHDYVLGLSAIASPALRVVFYDQRGTGRSTAPRPDPATGKERWNIDAYVDDLEAVRAAVGTRRPHILGHSWGGAIALAYAGRYVDYLRSLTLVDTSAITGKSDRLMQQRIEARLGELQREGLIPNPLPDPSGDDFMAAQRAVAPIYYADPRHPATKIAQQGTSSDRAQQRTFETLAQLDLRPRAARIAVPILHIYGAADCFQVAEHLADLRSALPQARTVSVPNCGHIPWIEQPAIFWRELRAFLGAVERDGDS